MKKKLLVWILFFVFAAIYMTGLPGTCQAKAETLRLGYFPIANLTPLFVANEKGYFKDLDIRLELKKMMGSPLIASAIAAGNIDGGSMSFITQALSKERDLPMRLIASFGYCAPGKEDQSLVVLKDSPIKSLADVNGHKIGGPMKATEPWFWTMNALKASHVTNYRYIEMRTPETPMALKAKTIDVAQLSEPNLTMLAPDIRILQRLGNVTGACGYAFNEKLLKDKPELIHRFIKALGMAVAYIVQNETDARKIMAKYTGVPEKVALKVILPSWDRKSRILMDEAGKEIDWMMEYQMIPQRPSLDNLFDYRFTGKTTIQELVRESSSSAK